MSNMMKLAAAAFVLALPAVAQAQEAVKVRLKWVAQAQFAGLYVAEAKGFYKDEGLDITILPGGPNLNVETLVASGSEDFGIASGTEGVLYSREKGLPIVALGLSQQATPHAYVSYKDSGIETVEDLKGQTVATWFTGTQYTLFAMLAANGISQDDLNIVSQPFSMQPFIDGEYPVATVTLYNEYNTLVEQGITDLNIIYPQDSGVISQQDAIITSEKMIAERPETVQKFLNATLRGWAYAIANPEEAVDIVMAAGTGLERRHQELMLAKISELMLDGTGTSEGLGYLNMDAVTKVHDNLVNFEALKAPQDLAKAFDASFWGKVPAEYKTVAK